MKTPREFAKEVSPSDDGLRVQLERSGFAKHVYDWMKRYAEYYVSSLPKEESACENCKGKVIVTSEYRCDGCGTAIIKES